MEHPQVSGFDPPAWWRALLVVALNTGLWKRTLFELCMNDIDWQSHRLVISPTRFKTGRGHRLGRHPRFRIYAAAEKGNEDRILPMTPDFAEFVLQTPQEVREGRVFKLIGNTPTGEPITPKRVCRIVSAIGTAAGLVVNKADGKFASAHDLRRSFGTRWAPRVKPATLQRLMRHALIQTTLRYSVELDADEMAEELWQAHGSIDSFINSRPKTTPHSSEPSSVRNAESVSPQDL